MGSSYSRFITKHPIKGQSATACVIGGVGDLLMQTYERMTQKESSSLDLSRTGRLAFYRGFLIGPFYALWLRGLDRHVILGSQLRVVAGKTLLDQFVFTPPKMIYFYTTMAMMEGFAMRDAFERAKPKVWPTLQINWPLWCCIQSITFSVVPLQYRMAFIGLADTLWNAWLSGMSVANLSVERAEVMNESLVPDVGFSDILAGMTTAAS